MGIAELFVIAIVGLLVIGPEKLPETIKTCLQWFGRVKRVLNDTRNELEQQLGVDEIRREIHNEEIMDSLKALKKATEEAKQTTQTAGDEVAKVGQSIQQKFEPEDEGLFGEQHANHPPSPAEETPPINKESS